MNQEEHVMLIVKLSLKLQSSLCHYSDAYILVKGKITIAGAGNDAAGRQADERDKGVVFKNCAPFINCMAMLKTLIL